MNRVNNICIFSPFRIAGRAVQSHIRLRKLARRWEKDAQPATSHDFNLDDEDDEQFQRMMAQHNQHMMTQAENAANHALLVSDL